MSNSLKTWVKLIAVIMSLTLLLCGCGSGNGGSGSDDIDSVAKDAAEYLVGEVEVDSLDTMGGGWIPFAVKKSGTDAADDEYYEAYYDSVRAAAKAGKGILSEDQPTANERVSMNLYAIGKDPTKVEGFDLMKVVDDYEKIKEQGLNAEIYALISSGYTTYGLKNEEKYLEDIVKSQFDDGSFGMDKEHPDADMTAMALQALSFYTFKGKSDVEKTENATHEMALGAEHSVDEAIDKALAWLSGEQGKDGSYASSESTSQVILALGALGLDPLKDERFIKEDKTLYDGLMVYREGKGFCHAREENVDAEAEVLATEQALMALAQLKCEKGTSIFD